MKAGLINNQIFLGPLDRKEAQVVIKACNERAHSWIKDHGFTHEEAAILTAAADELTYAVLRQKISK